MTIDWEVSDPQQCKPLYDALFDIPVQVVDYVTMR
jgi:hypothetical protein